MTPLRRPSFPARGPCVRASRRAVLAGLLASLSGLALTGCGRRPSGTPLAADARILCVGDSLTRGRGAEPAMSYPSQLAARSGRDVVNAGVDGDTSEAVLARLPGLLAQHRPALVLLGAGGNDFLRKVPLQRTREALTQAIGLCRAQAQVVLIAQPRASILHALAQSLEDHPLYAELSERLEVPCFEGAWSRVLSSPSLRADPVHANEQGYARFCDELLEWLTQEAFL